MLKKEFANIKYYQAAVALGLAFLFIIVGSFFDLQISQSIVSFGNVFGQICAYLGPLPGYVIFGSVGILFFLRNEDGEGKSTFYLSAACLVIFPLLSGALYGIQVFDETFSSSVLQAFVGILIVSFCEVGVYFLCRKGNKNDCYTIAITFLFSFVTVFALLYLLKKAGLRPRYIFLNEINDFSYYRNWWDFDSTVQAAFPDTASTMFESWPSGHAGLAAFSIVGILYCKLNEKMKGKENIYFYVSLAFTFLVSFGRVLDGHHFVSDVAFGAFFSYLFAFLVIYLVFLPKPTESEKEDDEYTTLIGNYSLCKGTMNSPRQKDIQKKKAQSNINKKPHKRKKSL